MRVQQNQRVPMADGTELATDVYLPDGRGQFPVVLTRTPYGRNGDDPPWPDGLPGRAAAFTARGFAFVVQDCRGKFESDGRFRLLVDEGDDTHATVDWIAEHRWCSGRVALWGRSYLGMIQVPGASRGHPALACIVPSTCAASFFRDWLHRDGILCLGNALKWAVDTAALRTAPATGHVDWDAVYRARGLAEVESRVGLALPMLADWARHDRQDAFWDALDQTSMHARVAVPGMHLGGWWDPHCRGQLQHFCGLRRNASSAPARAGQRLLMGPWWHLNVDAVGEAHTRHGQLDFGPGGDLATFAEELRFLDLHLRDVDDGLADTPPVRVFMMGDNRWLELSDWPPPGTTNRAWFLTSTGELEPAAPDGDATRVLASDPDDPVPTVGGPIYHGLDRPAGPVDLSPLLARADVLVFRSRPLAEPLAVIGEAFLTLVLAADVEDLDVVARLAVETTEGALLCLSLGNGRVRFRDGFTEPRPLGRGETARMTVALTATAFRFPAASRIVLLIAGSDFPRLQPNAHRLVPSWSGSERVIAHSEILLGPSRLVLPVGPDGL